MKNALVLILVLAVAAGGYYWYQGGDTRYARQVMDCMYAGSFEPIKDTLNDEAKKAMDNPAIKAQLPQAGAQMKAHFGEIKTLKFKSEAPVEAAFVKAFGEGAVKKTWDATSDKGKFELALVVDKDGKLLTLLPGRLTPL